MTADVYETISNPFRKRPALLKGVLLLNRLLTVLGFMSYPVLLLVCLYRHDPRFHWFILIPGLGFASLSLFRKCVNAKRPYEKLAIVPLIPKSTRGKSFPSRHVFSMEIIAGCWYGVYPPAGFVLTFTGTILALIRVIGGVHFPRDVLTGGAVGLGLGLLILLV